MDKSTGQLKTVNAALDVFTYISEQDGSVRLSDISAYFQFPNSKVHRILSSLVSRDYVTQNKTSRTYSLGLRAWLLGRQLHPYQILVESIKSPMDELAKKANETVVFTTLDGDTVVYLYGKHGPQQVLAVIKEGTRVPLHATATGKAILAGLNNESLNNLLQSKMEKYTPTTLCSIEDITKDIEQTQSRGYSIAIDEYSIGLAGVGASGPNFVSTIPWAIGISWPMIRHSDQKVINMGKLAQETVTSIRNILEI